MGHRLNCRYWTGKECLAGYPFLQAKYKGIGEIGLATFTASFDNVDVDLVDVDPTVDVVDTPTVTQSTPTVTQSTPQAQIDTSDEKFLEVDPEDLNTSEYVVQKMKIEQRDIDTASKFIDTPPEDSEATAEPDVFDDVTHSLLSKTEKYFPTDSKGKKQFPIVAQIGLSAAWALVGGYYGWKKKNKVLKYSALLSGTGAGILIAHHCLGFWK